jgi:hypothetical protein
MELKRMTAGNGKNTLEWFQFNPEGVAVRLKRSFRCAIGRTKGQWDDSTDASWVFLSLAQGFFVLRIIPIFTMRPFPLAMRRWTNSWTMMKTAKTFTSNIALTSSIFMSVAGTG